MTNQAPAVTSEEFDEIDAILDDLRERNDETPQWEFCEGVMAALICSRRAISADEYLDVLLGVAPETVPTEKPAEELAEFEGSFADASQRQRFMDIWTKRWEEIASALSKEIESLDDEHAYQPEITDVRGAIASLSDEERAELGDDPVPSFAQVWALGFMFVVENWPEEWAPPKDKDAAKWLDAALESVVALTEVDAGAPEVSPYSDNTPPTMSKARVNAFADGMWAVYDLYELRRGMTARASGSEFSLAK